MLIVGVAGASAVAVGGLVGLALWGIESIEILYRRYAG